MFLLENLVGINLCVPAKLLKKFTLMYTKIDPCKNYYD